MKTAWILAGLMAASLPLSAAQLYQWKDAQGRTVYSDHPPPPSVKNAQHKTFRPSVIDVNESYATRSARDRFPVTLYASACGQPCDQARHLLNQRGIPYSSKDPQASEEARAELQKLTGQLRVPLLIVGTEKLDGFESEQWNGALDRAGYPKSAPFGRKPADAAPAAPAPAAQPGPN